MVRLPEEPTPTPYEMVHQLLEALGRDGAYPQSPAEVWRRALVEVRVLCQRAGGPWPSDANLDREEG
jgi:hypothetical protein